VIKNRPAAARLLRTARRSAGLSQRALASKSHVPQPTIAAIETGRQDPRFATLLALVESCEQEIATLPKLGGAVDRSQIRERLRLTPGQRLRASGVNAVALRRFLGSRRP